MNWIPACAGISGHGGNEWQGSIRARAHAAQRCEPQLHFAAQIVLRIAE
jgi:hypothetical protein